MNKMNTLAFVNFLLVKLFPTLIHQIFRRQKFAPYGICKYSDTHRISWIFAAFNEGTVLAIIGYQCNSVGVFG